MKKTASKKRSKKYIGIGIAVAVLVILSLLFLAPATIAYTTQESYQTQRTVALQYDIINAYQKGDFSGLNYITQGYVTLENIDTEPGTFVVNCDFRALKRNFADEDRIYILPGESKTATCNVDTNYGEDVEFTYTVTPATKTVSVTDYRTVTKTRQVRLYQKLFGLY